MAHDTPSISADGRSSAESRRRLWLSGGDYRLTRTALQRGLALVYLIAFLVAENQFVPLCGERGLLPVPRFVEQVPFSAAPSLFFWFPHDRAFTLAAWLGVEIGRAHV